MPPGRKPIVCYVTDRRAFESAPLAAEAPENQKSEVALQSLHAAIRRAISAGADWIQIREKDLDGAPLAKLARFAVAEAHSSCANANEGRAPLEVFLNDRLDAALVSNAGGIHLGEKSLPLESVVAWRRSSGRLDFRIGVSCHSLEAARAAETGGADYIFFGPVFATPSKATFGAPQGLDRLREVCSSIKIPVIAIGGIGAENARSCVDAGAAGIAAIRLFQEAGSDEELAAKIEL